jgi:hypothetical protein
VPAPGAVPRDDVSVRVGLKEDGIALAEHISGRSKRLRQTVFAVGEKTVAAEKTYAWPGMGCSEIHSFWAAWKACRMA